MKLQPTRFKSDTLLFDFKIDTNVSGWDIRAEFYDLFGNYIRLANTTSGGDDNQIEITSTSSNKSLFTIKVQKDLTDCFKAESFLEVEVENTLSPTQKFTIFQGEVVLKNKKIDWESPS